MTKLNVECDHKQFDKNWRTCWECRVRLHDWDMTAMMDYFATAEHGTPETVPQWMAQLYAEHGLFPLLD